MQNQSLDGIEEELARIDRKLATLRDTLRRSHQESAADAAALRELGARVKEIMSRPKTWRGGSKRSDAAEIEALRAEMRSRSEAENRLVEAMKSMSAEATQLSKRQQDLSKTRADLVARGATTGPSAGPPNPSVLRPAPPKPDVPATPSKGEPPSLPASPTRRRRPLT
jgi:chromosome segregation ATPase